MLIAPVATGDTTSPTEAASILSLIMLGQLTAVARPGTARMPSARSAHRDGYSTTMESAFLFQSNAEHPLQMEIVIPVTRDMTW